MLWTNRLKITQLAQCTLPVGPLRVNLIDTAKHVVPKAEYWRTGVQIPPAPPNEAPTKPALCGLCCIWGLGKYRFRWSWREVPLCRAVNTITPISVVANANRWPPILPAPTPGSQNHPVP